MPDSKEPTSSPPPARSSPRFYMRQMWLALLLASTVLFMLWYGGQPNSKHIEDYRFFEEQVQAGNVLQVQIQGSTLSGIFKEEPIAPDTIDAKTGEIKKNDTEPQKRLPKHFTVTLLAGDLTRDKLKTLLEKHNVAFSESEAADGIAYLYLLSIVVSVIMVAAVWMMLRRTQNQMLGGGFLSGFTKSPAKRYEGAKQVTTFNDVAGLEGVKADLLEIVEFLKNPQKFRRLGGHIPKGVLLNGPPGTGKTLLARAVAGEAGVPFFSVSGSEFIQMFVGVGASRVRDLFQTAKEAAPAIIFVDEIDAVGRQRGAGLGGGHDEREQTLNQILNEMDGFTQNDTVIVLAATNRPDVLDPALLRPGRFDRHVTVDRPTLKGRVEIFKVHVREVPLDADVDLERLAAQTVGLTGADIRNIVNEAALWAARNNKSSVAADDFEYARDKILIGPKREEVLLGKEKERTAYHEAGHTILAWTQPGSHRVHKVTVIPRGRSLGATHMLPAEERLTMSQADLRNHLCGILAGRAAELNVYGDSDPGAENDLERATWIARRMVAHWGMSDRIGPVSYKFSDDDPFLGRELHQQRQFSEHTLESIDTEVTRILNESDARARKILAEKRPLLDSLAHVLVEKEELDEHEIAAILGPSVHDEAQSNGKPRPGVAEAEPGTVAPTDRGK